MGYQKVKEISGLEDQQEFLSHLLQDIEALELMIREEMFEKDTVRVGAEQELCLVDNNFRPSKKALEVLKNIGDDHFTTELALFNMEINLDPLFFKDTCFSDLEKELKRLLKKARKQAEKVEKNKIILTGILPTIKKNNLIIENITPFDRYRTLNRILRKMRGDDFKLHIKGVDELIVTHETILFEACNTSFQIHLQIEPGKIVDQFNWAQLIAGPVLAACSNSPLLMGRELWSETRIALFQQSLDVRNVSYLLRGQKARVSFGSSWVKDSILELYKDDIARYPPIITTNFKKDSLQELKEGRIPELMALNIFNGTLYKWNRLCYGITEGKPHFRIENRYIPAGPSVKDEIANAVFWIGLMQGMPDQYRNLNKKIPFNDARGNFTNAARTGINTYFRWFGENISAKELILKTLIPIAREGLLSYGISEKDVTKYLNILRKRVESGQTGSVWQIQSKRVLKETLNKDMANTSLTACMYKNQLTGKPVHQWKLVNIEDCYPIDIQKRKLEKVMTTEVFVVDENDLISLADKVMQWKNINHLPVVNKQNELIGIISKNNIKNIDLNKNKLLVVKDYMISDVIKTGPKTSIEKARNIMISNKIGSLPVIDNDNLIGIITKSDLLNIYNTSTDYERE